MNVRAMALVLACLTPVAALCQAPVVPVPSLAAPAPPSLAPAAPAASPSPPPPEDRWTGKGQGGFLSSKGNSDSEAANAALDAALIDGPWKHALHVDGLYGKSAGIASAERWDAQWQTNYALTKRLYAFGGLRYERDMFSGFQYQATANVGMGYKFFDSSATKLDVQVGVGYRKLRPEELTMDADGRVISRTLQPAQDSAVGTVGVNYSQGLTKTTTLTDSLLVEAGSQDTLITNVLALAVKISTKLALSVGYGIQDNTAPPAGLKSLDTLETLNLVYAF